MSENQVPFDLNRYISGLLRGEPFYAALSRQMDKVATTVVPTAGVMFNVERNTFELLYNAEFFGTLSERERLGVLKHEFMHCILEHVTSRLPESGMSMMWNYATDLAINSHIADELPDMALVPGKVDTPFESYPKYKSADWYFDYLKQDPKMKQQPEQGDGQGGEGDEQDGEGQGQESGDGKQGQKSSGMPQTLDDHSQWGNVSKDMQDQVKERMKRAIEKAHQEVTQQGSGYGSVPGDVKKHIESIVYGTVDWRKVLENFIKRSKRADKFSTVRRRNRKYDHMAGKRVRRQASIAISIDQSGSVHDAMLQSFFAELQRLASLASFTVIPFDSVVREDKIFEWKKGENRPWERVSCGGTDFNPPTKYVNAHKFDAHIILTDMYAPKPIASKCQRLWMAPADCYRRPYFKVDAKDRVITID
jgi:predicted metal-dependent peptidase